MKPASHWFNIAIICALVVLILNTWRPQAPALALSPQTADDSCDGSRAVHASGTAVIYVTPDRALIQLGVQSNGVTPEGTQRANLQAIQEVMRALRALGIQEKDIATDYYIVYPVYDDYNSLFIKGYRIDNTISITLQDVNLADEVIITALKAGANEVQEVQFYTSQLRQYRDQARALAMKAAGEKAQALAEAGGAQAGCLLSASENTWSHYYGSWRGGRQAAVWTQNTMVNTGFSQGEQPPSEDSPITLGQIVVRAEVSTSYSLK